MWRYISPELAQTIKEYIKGDNITYTEFAEDFLGISYDYFTKMLRDNYPMNGKIRTKLVEVTGLDYAYVLDNTNISGSPANFKGYVTK